MVDQVLPVLAAFVRVVGLLTFCLASTGDCRVEVELKRVLVLSKRCERAAVDALLLLPLELSQHMFH